MRVPGYLHVAGVVTREDGSSPACNRAVHAAGTRACFFVSDYILLFGVTACVSQATVDADESVSLEACEFWSAVCETRVAKEALGGSLPQLMPVLLKGMVYSEEVQRVCIALSPRACFQFRLVCRTL